MAVRLAVPGAVVAGTVWMMVGCFRLPIGERVDLTHAGHDFRPMVGNYIGPGRVTRAGVRAVLGEPAVRSANGRVEVYTLITTRSVYVIPLCLAIVPNDRQLHALALRYDANGLLESQQVVVENVASSVGLITYTLKGAADEAFRGVLTQVDASNGVVEPRQAFGDRVPTVAGVRQDFSVVAANACGDQVESR